MNNKITINPSPPLPGGQFEVGDVNTLQAGGSVGEVRWKAAPDSIVTLLPQDDGTCVVEGIGFGQVTVSVTDDNEAQGSIILCVGSVIIAAADGQYWQVFPDGSSSKLPDGEVSPTIKTLVDSNAVIADVTGMDLKKPNSATPAAEAVTCYVLNLASFPLHKKKKQG